MADETAQRLLHDGTNDQRRMKMDAETLTAMISDAKKCTQVKVYLKCRQKLEFPNAFQFGDHDQIIIGDYKLIVPILSRHKDDIEQMHIETMCVNSAIPLKDTKYLHARIEPGAIIRDYVEIKDRAVIMMGAIINIGASIGYDTMIDMGAVLGGRAIVKDRCHIGANAVLSGVIEPPSAKPVIIEDDVMIGANAVILEGVHVHKGAVVAAGAVVTQDVDENTLVAGVPAKIIKQRDEKTTKKTTQVKALRQL